MGRPLRREGRPARSSGRSASACRQATANRRRRTSSGERHCGKSRHRLPPASRSCRPRGPSKKTTSSMRRVPWPRIYLRGDRTAVFGSSTGATCRRTYALPRPRSGPSTVHHPAQSPQNHQTCTSVPLLRLYHHSRRSPQGGGHARAGRGSTRAGVMVANASARVRRVFPGVRFHRCSRSSWARSYQAVPCLIVRSPVCSPNGSPSRAAVMHASHQASRSAPCAYAALSTTSRPAPPPSTAGADSVRGVDDPRFGQPGIVGYMRAMPDDMPFPA